MNTIILKESLIQEGIAEPVQHLLDAQNYHQTQWFRERVRSENTSFHTNVTTTPTIAAIAREEIFGPEYA